MERVRTRQGASSVTTLGTILVRRMSRIFDLSRMGAGIFLGRPSEIVEAHF